MPTWPSPTRTFASNERSDGERSGLLRMPPAELPNLPLQDALQLVHLYAEKGSPKCEKAALPWLGRYLTESSLRLQHFTKRPALTGRSDHSGRRDSNSGPLVPQTAQRMAGGVRRWREVAPHHRFWAPRRLSERSRSGTFVGS